MKAFEDHGIVSDPQAKAKRLALVNELRKSNLPTQNFNIPKSTAQEAYISSNADADNSLATEQRKAVHLRNRKPNFTLGTYKSDYQSENRGSMTKPMSYSFDATAMKKQVAT